MSNWIVQTRLTGEVVHAYGADDPGHYDVFPLDTYNHVKAVTTEPVVERRVSKVEYLRRFTSDERIAIRQAATVSPVLDDYLEMLKLAEEINLDDADTMAAVNMLEHGGLLSAGRAAEILA